MDPQPHISQLGSKGGSWRPVDILLLGSTLALFIWLQIGAWMPSLAPALLQAGGNDLKLYKSVAQRVLAGESYYVAAAEELTAQGYPTASVFNWRPPLYAWIIRAVGSLIAWQCIVALASMIVIALTLRTCAREIGLLGACAIVILQSGAFLWCVDGDAYLAQELFAGVLITLSFLCYSQGAWPLGVLIAGVGLFYRELVLPYCAVCGLIAICSKRWREVAVWALIAIGWVVYTLWHFQQVAVRQTEEAVASTGWVRFGGATFLLKTARMNEWLFRLPTPFLAIYLSIAWLGSWCWPSPTTWRLGGTLTLYLCLFSVVGQPFNDYWGLLYAGLLPLGYLHLHSFAKRVLRHPPPVVE